MVRINDNFLHLQKNYLFVEVAKRVALYKDEHPGAPVIRLGIGDVTRPLAPAVIQALHKAVDEQADAETFRGYGPEQGYAFLRRAIAENDYMPRGVKLDEDEIFISDGAKSDTGNFGDILGSDNTLLITDPVYPVYLDSNVMAGRAGENTGDAWSRVVYAHCTAENGFVPPIPTESVDMIYLCYPNNPTGTVLSREELAKWVDYALRTGALILYDAAYAAYIRHDGIPQSIYEIYGARRCAVEFRSYSKTAGFTGLRCGYTVVPKDVTAMTADGRLEALNPLWNRRQSTKFNGAPYIVQRAAEAVYSPEGKKQVRETIDYYMENARIICDGLDAVGLRFFGGEDAPYIWLRVPEGQTSWGYWEELLNRYNIISTPGVGFGSCGEGYVRLTAFGSRDDCVEAMRRLRKE